MIAAPPKAKPGPKPRGDDRTVRMVIRCSPAWRDWLNAWSDADPASRPATDIIEDALAFYAYAHKVDQPPKR